MFFQCCHSSFPVIIFKTTVHSLYLKRFATIFSRKKFFISVLADNNNEFREEKPENPENRPKSFLMPIGKSALYSAITQNFVESRYTAAVHPIRRLQITFHELRNYSNFPYSNNFYSFHIIYFSVSQFHLCLQFIFRQF